MNAIIALQTDLQQFIDYLKATEPSDWYLHKVRNKTNTKNCLYGHLVNWYYGKDYEGSVSNIWDAFEEMATTFYVYPINDGQNPKYPQKTARERCIALMENYRDGKELWTEQAIKQEMKEKGVRVLTCAPFLFLYKVALNQIDQSFI